MQWKNSLESPELNLYHTNHSLSYHQLRFSPSYISNLDTSSLSLSTGHDGRSLWHHSILHGRVVWSPVLVQSPDTQWDLHPGGLRGPSGWWYHVVVGGISRASRWAQRVAVWPLPLRTDTGLPHGHYSHITENGEQKNTFFCHGSRNHHGIISFDFLLWFFILLVCRTLPWATGKATSYSLFWGGGFCHCCLIFLPSPPTPSLPCAYAVSRMTLKAPKTAGLWIYQLFGHDCRPVASNTHNRISFHQNRSKGCLLLLARLACFLRYVSNVNIAGGRRVAKRHRNAYKSNHMGTCLVMIHICC